MAVPERQPRNILRCCWPQAKIRLVTAQERNIRIRLQKSSDRRVPVRLNLDRNRPTEHHDNRSHRTRIAACKTLATRLHHMIPIH